VSSIDTAVERLREAAQRQDPWPPRYRRTLLTRLDRSLRNRKNALFESVRKDFGFRSEFETYSADYMATLMAIRHSRRNVGSWARPRRIPGSPFFAFGRSVVDHQPLGVVGVISAWNYPVNLALIPLAEALAAGNRVLLKPSERAPSTAELLVSIVRDALAPTEADVVLGGAETSLALAASPIDHLFFTGSQAAARSLARTASDRLTPTTMELGGKSPALIGPTYPAVRAARAVVRGKLFNAGQTCVAPDYLLAPRDRLEEVSLALQREIDRQTEHLTDYTHMIDARAADRIRRLLSDAARRGATVVEAGFIEDSGCRLGPRLVIEPPAGSLVMQEEIFGPVLPVVGYQSMEEAIEFIRARSRPLVLYLFAGARDRPQRILTRVPSGTAAVNDTLLQAGLPNLPFGGIGQSGHGRYHGFSGFRTFSSVRGIRWQSRFSLTGLVRPPLTGRMLAVLRLFFG
jgi:coniferyl-aldehyde dehydrogenase